MSATQATVQKVTQTSKGQITLPVNIRRKLKMDAGDRWAVKEQDGVVELIPERKTSRFAKYKGTVDFGIPKGMSVVEFVRRMRDGV
jgi:AbrB family looped-hinge helix DNA binding protein